MSELKQASPSAQVGLVAAPVTLSYDPQTHQFQLTVTGVTQAVYQLEYSSVNQDGKKIRQAINKSGPADAQGVYSQTILAGTQSGDDQFVHDVTEGKLEIIATRTDGQREQYLLTFSVDEKGVMNINSFTATPAAELSQTVMGSQTAAADQPIDGLAKTDKLLAQVQNQHPAIQTNWYDQYLNQQTLIRTLPIVLIIGCSILMVAVYSLWQSRRQNTNFLHKLN